MSTLTSHTPHTSQTSHTEPETVVQLRFAPLPYLLRRIAVHHWFVLWEPGEERPRRWEVWQNRDAGGTSWGHLHRDLMHPDSGVGGGPYLLAAEWRGEEAEALREVLNDPLAYPYRDLYRFWPGPNSNTYAAWVLRAAGVSFILDRRGHGRGYPVQAASRSRTHSRSSSPTGGVGSRSYRSE